jgi:HEPN domain-containing protein
VRHSAAWVEQAMSDLQAAQRLYDRENARTFCQAISKYQQAVEKAVKGVVAALQHGGVFTGGPGNRHPANPLISAILRLPRSDENRELMKRLERIFSETRRHQIEMMDNLVPVYPDPGQPHLRNHEYPFQDDVGDWLPPCDEAAFAKGEIKRFAATAVPVCRSLGEIVSGLERIYP